MVTFPNAKINIGLDILRKRPDGYHDISTVMVPIPWTDVLEIVPSSGEGADRLSVSGRVVDCPPEKNLVMKAVAAMRERFRFPPVDVFLHKVIPDGAGLGGGSADAAFALVMLNGMFGMGLSSGDLTAIAASLGADCPFFVFNKPMLCEGTGTDMSEFDLCLPADVVLAVVKPQVSVPTAVAYAAVSPSVPDVSLPQAINSLPVEQWQGRVKNDFEQWVFKSYPGIGGIKRFLLKCGAIYASMSGSGSAVYGLFRGADCDKLTAELRVSLPGCDIMVTPFVL